MIEVFSGTATLCSVSKFFGVENSIALDKIKKKASRATVFVFDVLKASDRELLYHWLQSPLVCWVHFAPVCGTCSRAREIDNGGPPPLRSEEFPMGLPSLSEDERARVHTANLLYHYACEIAIHCAELGLLITMENPSRSLYWLTDPFVSLAAVVALSYTNFQLRMLGGPRDKWTQIAANFSAIAELDIACDGNHPHLPWGKVRDETGRIVYATATEAQYPRKMCVALVQCVMRQLERQHMDMPPNTLLDAQAHRSFETQAARIASMNQSKRNKIPPMVPDVSSVAVFYATDTAAIPIQVMGKLQQECNLHSISGQPCVVPAHSRLLRLNQCTSPPQHGGKAAFGEETKTFEAAFGLPWTCEEFIAKAAELGHPSNFCKRIPLDIKHALDVHLNYSDQQISSMRLDWCKKWLTRALELDKEEKADASMRHSSTAHKRLRLTEEILQDMKYEDCQVLDIMKHGSTLAGDIDACPVFQSSYKPCLTTLAQLEANADARNQLVLSMTRSLGDDELDDAVVAETELEVQRGWADGPWELSDLRPGSTISRRFAIRQLKR